MTQEEYYLPVGAVNFFKEVFHKKESSGNCMDLRNVTKEMESFIRAVIQLVDSIAERLVFPSLTSGGICIRPSNHTFPQDGMVMV